MSKLYVIDIGDSSVGMSQQTWVVECPFDYEHSDKETIEEFRELVWKLYEPFADTRLLILYDEEQPLFD